MKEEIKGKEVKKRYFDQTAATLKTRFRNHISDLKLVSKKHSTVLSSHILEAKKRAEDNSMPEVKWYIMSKPQPYRRGKNHCNFCLSEKQEIRETIC